MIDFIINFGKILYIMNRHFLLTYIFICLFSINSFGQKPYMPNGGMFTPEGELKALVVFVGFSHNIWNGKDSIPFNHQRYDQWDIKNGQELPPYVDLETGEISIFHDELSDFEKDDKWNNISDYYHQMSLGKLKFMAECLKDPVTNKPIRIDIDPRPLNSIKQFNQAAMDMIFEKYPNFDWTQFDTRTNSPAYRKNTNNTRSDGKPECIIFIYRNHKGMKTQIHVTHKLGWGGGVATSYLGGYKSKWENIKFDNTGFTLSDESGKSEDSFISMFLHEIGHKLYSAPHYNGANGTVGNYFFYPGFSYGMMNSTNFSNMTANGWERWILGWINLDKNNIDAKTSIKHIDNKTYSFVLNDFVTTGDAIRLPIPHYRNNFLWIENHQNISVMEKGSFQGRTMSADGEVVPKLESGIYVYVEGISPNRNKIPSYGNRLQSNGLRMYHADGNWDYYKSDDITRSWYTYFNQPVLSVSKKQRNIFSGTNPFQRVIGDYPKGWKKENETDGKITYRSSLHGGYIESVPFSRENLDEDTLTVYGFSGGRTENMRKVLDSRSCFFQSGDDLSINSNNPIFGLQRYNKRNGLLEPIHINGMSVTFKALNNSDYLVTVSYDDFKLEKDKRWTGHLNILPNYLDSNKYALELGEKVVLTLDKSGTINTHIMTDKKDFIVNSHLVLEAGSKILMNENSKLLIKNNSKLTIKSGASINMLRKSEIYIEKGSELIIEEGGLINKKKGGKVIIE